MKCLELDGKMVGPGYPVYIIAEISANHNRDKNVVHQLIDIAAEAGFDAVKLRHAMSIMNMYTVTVTGGKWPGMKS